MPISYTPAALAMLRAAADRSTPRAEVQRLLGWDNTMLAAVCRKHGIDLVGAIPPSQPISSPVVRSLPVVSERNQLRALANTMSGGASAIMLQRIIRYPIGEIVPSAHLGVDGRNASSCRYHINNVLRKANLPFAVEGVTRGYDGGYRLVRSEDVDGAA